MIIALLGSFALLILNLLIFLYVRSSVLQKIVSIIDDVLTFILFFDFHFYWRMRTVKGINYFLIILLLFILIPFNSILSSFPDQPQYYLAFYFIGLIGLFSASTFLMYRLSDRARVNQANQNRDKFNQFLDDLE